MSNKTQLQQNNIDLARIAEETVKLEGHGQFVWKKYAKTKYKVKLSVPTDNPLAIKFEYIGSPDDKPDFTKDDLVGKIIKIVDADKSLEVLLTILNNKYLEVRPEGSPHASVVEYTINYDSTLPTLPISISTGSISGNWSINDVWDAEGFKKDEFVGYVLSNNETAYPNGGWKDGYWYEKDSAKHVWRKLTVADKLEIKLSVIEVTDINFTIGLEKCMGNNKAMREFSCVGKSVKIRNGDSTIDCVFGHSMVDCTENGVTTSYYYMGNTSYGEVISIYIADISINKDASTDDVWIQEGTQRGEFLGYVISDDENAYPENKVQDGYYYEKDSGKYVWEVGMVIPEIKVENKVGFYGDIWKYADKSGSQLKIRYILGYDATNNPFQIQIDNVEDWVSFLNGFLSKASSGNPPRYKLYEFTNQIKPGVLSLTERETNKTFDASDFKIEITENEGVILTALFNGVFNNTSYLTFEYVGEQIIRNRKIEPLGYTLSDDPNKYPVDGELDGKYYRKLQEYVTDLYMGDLITRFYRGQTVVLNNEIHIVSHYNAPLRHDKWNGSSWTSVSTLPFDCSRGQAVIFNDEIHILGSSNVSSHTKHYKWNGSTWTYVSTLPYDFYWGQAVVLNNEIHILGTRGSGNTKKHYKWNGSTWTSVSTLPYDFYNGKAVVYKDEIHILSGDTGNTKKHYKFNGSSWTSVSTLPYDFYNGSAVVYKDEIHILGGGNVGESASTKHYKWNGSSWVEVSTLPYDFQDGSAVVYKDEIHTLGGGGSSSSSYNAKHYALQTKIIRVS